MTKPTHRFGFPVLIVATLMTLGVTTTAQASWVYFVDPEYGELNESRWELNEDQPLHSDEIENMIGSEHELTLLYSDSRYGDEGGPYAGDYDTKYELWWDPANQDAILKWNWWDGDYIESEMKILQVQAGESDPNTYVFDISAWNGRQLIYLNDFFPGPGEITYVSIHGAEKVPEPTTVASLASLGLCWGARSLRRRRRSKA